MPPYERVILSSEFLTSLPPYLYNVAAMRRFTSLPRPVLLALAVLFVATTVAYSAIWMYYVRQTGPAPEQQLPERIARELVMSFPVLFLVVGVPVLFLRLRDRNAWLLNLLFAGLIAAAPITIIEDAIPRGLRGLTLCYAFILRGMLPAVTYYFFAVFPARSPMDRRVPWLKYLLVVVMSVVSFPLGTWALLEGSSRPIEGWFSRFAGDWDTPVAAGLLVGFALGLASLILNTLHNPSVEARRKCRVIVWGMVAGLTPLSGLLASRAFTGKMYYELPYWVWTPGVIAVFLVPISFAYAVVKHRVLEVPVLLKRSARYFLVRGSFSVAMTAVAVLVPVNFANVAAQSLNFPTDAVVPFALLLGVVFGALWVVGAGEIEKRITARIDRAFFRSVYDARRILQDLAKTARTVSSREQLAALLQQHIREALHPRSLVVYFEEAEGVLRRHGPAGELPEALSADSPLLTELAAHARPWEVPAGEEWVPSGSYAVVNLPQLANLRALLDEQMARPPTPSAGTDVIAVLAPAAPECLVPLVGRDARLAGLLVLGGRLSEEPYSDEDELLLASVADQAAIALENMRLAETMAQKIEAEQRAANEIAIAREVQAKLFPQTHPPMATIEYAGLCDQARKVGGDYYDFLDLGPGRIGLALADISGKGIFAALLMANLQANLRSQYARALDDLPGLMRSVNRQFQQSTAIGLFATMFFADYSDQTRRLRYINCGHNPPLLVRTDGSCQRLQPTAAVIGLLEDWECEVGEAQLRPGDLLVVYSDGVTEAQSDAGEFFGEARLQEAARRHAQMPIAEATRAIAKTVHAFSESEQEDDLTLLVARALPPR